MGIADWMLETVDRAAGWVADQPRPRRERSEYGTPPIIAEREKDEDRPRKREDKSWLETLNDGLLKLNDAVGNGRRNEERDVERVDRRLAWLDFRPAEKREQPDSYITRGLDTAIKLFQKANNLKVDGWLAPGGETEEALNTQLSLKAKDQKPASSTTTIIKKDPEPAAAAAPEASKSNPDADPERDATGKRVRTSDVVIPPRKPDASVERKAAILDESKKADFHVIPNLAASGERPKHTIEYFSEVKENEKTIEREAKKAGVDPDFVKAVVYLETTQGHYDRLAMFRDWVMNGTGLSKTRVHKSIRPMNVHVEEWKDLGYSRDDLKVPEKNIEAGVKLISKIKQRMPDASPEAIASVYNALGTRKVTDYGMRVKKLMEEKPWEK